MTFFSKSRSLIEGPWNMSAIPDFTYAEHAASAHPISRAGSKKTAPCFRPQSATLPFTEHSLRFSNCSGRPASFRTLLSISSFRLRLSQITAE